MSTTKRGGKPRRWRYVGGARVTFHTEPPFTVKPQDEVQPVGDGQADLMGWHPDFEEV